MVMVSRRDPRRRSSAARYRTCDMTAPRGGENGEGRATGDARMPVAANREPYKRTAGRKRAPNPYQTRNPKAARPSKAKRKISPSRVEHDNRRKEPSADPRADQKARSAARPWPTGIAPPTNCLQRPTPSQFTVRVTLSVTGPSTRFREGGECYNMLTANHLFFTHIYSERAVTVP